MKRLDQLPVADWLRQVQLVPLALASLGLALLALPAMADPLAGKQALFASCTALLAALAFARLWWKGALRLPLGRLGWALLALFAAVTLSFLASPLKAAAEASWDGWCLALLLFAAGFDLLREPLLARRWIALWLLALAATCAWGYAQLLGLDPSPWAGLSAAAFGGRPVAGFGNPNFMAGFLVLSLPLAAWWGLASPTRGRRWLGWGLCAAAALLAAASGSKAAWLALGFEWLALGHWLRRLPGGLGGGRLLGWALGGLLALGLALAVAPAESRGRVLGSFGQGRESVSFRLNTWQGALAMGWQRPLLGQGPGTFRALYPAFRPAGAMAGQAQHQYEVTHPENWVMQAFAELGLLGLAALLFLLYQALWPSLAACHQAQVADGQGLERCLLTGIGASLVMNLASLDLFLPSTAFFFILALAHLAALRQKVRGLQARPEPYAGLLMSAGLFLFTMFVTGQALGLPQGSLLLRRAENLANAGQLAEALPQFQAAAQRDPANPEPWYFLGCASMDLGQPTGLTRAAQAFEQASQLSPDFALLNQRRGLLALRLGQADQAEAYFRRQIRVDPYYLPAVQQLTSLLAGQRRYAEAREVLEQAQPRFPERADLKANLELLRGQK